ncbi:MAG: NUDIX domain-containing protein [Actinomycetales bacterium]|nr:NUDIX domain-containing protein [Actinomycetales bacterium]
MPVHSAGLLAYRFCAPDRPKGEPVGPEEVGDHCIEVFLVHMGGPFWWRKDDGAWSLPKGEYDPDQEDSADAAVREFEEEVGVPWTGPLDLLGEFRQPSRKVLTVHHGAAPLMLEFVSSNLFEVEWPRNSGRIRRFPEVDRAEWFTLGEARAKLVPSQVQILDALLKRLRAAG